MVVDTSLIERTALKEWAVLVDAMSHGEIVAMVRKGGIREQRTGFAVRHDRFLFYPTFFHANVDELAPRFRSRLSALDGQRPPDGVIRLEYVADVIGLWAVSELELLRDIDGEHGLSWSAVESRFHYRGRPGVQVVAVRVARLVSPAVVPEIRRYQGCVSWVELDQPIDVGGAAPVLDDVSLITRLAVLRNALGPGITIQAPARAESSAPGEE